MAPVGRLQRCDHELVHVGILHVELISVNLYLCVFIRCMYVDLDLPVL